MAKAIEKDGKLYRMRRGKLVEIPAEWVGQIPTEQTKRKRRSNQNAAQRRAIPSHRLGDGSYDWSNYRNRRHEYPEE